MKFAAIFLFMLFATLSQAAITQKEYTTQKTEQTITIDGNLNDEAWLTAQWNEGFQMYYPSDNKQPSEPTSFAVIYDKDFIYVAIKAKDSTPELITKRLTRRDNLDGDFLGVQFDSYNDLQTAYVFMASAAGTKSDVFISEDGDSEDSSWDPIWWVETNITDEGWVAEMKIPFSQLRFVNNYEQTWGIQVERFIHRHDELSLWNAKKRDDPGWVHHYGKMKGLVNIEPKKVFDLYPYAVGSLSTYEEEVGNPYADGSDWDGNVGLDGKIGLTNNLTLDFTINPDFGQVEADPSSVNLSGFELFYEEKRPFFIEGNNILNFPLMFGDGDLAWENLFYSRRVGRSPHSYPDLEEGQYAKVPNNTKIIGAAKITGRTEDGLSIGVVESLTSNENAIIQNTEGDTWAETVEPMTNYAAASLQKDFGGGNTLLSGMVTSTNRFIKNDYLNYLHKEAYSGGLDFTKYWRDKTWFFSTKGSFSYVAGDSTAILSTQRSTTHNYQRPDATHITYDSSLTSLSGYSGTTQFGKVGGGRLQFVAATYFKSPGFEINDIGFVRHVDDIITIFWTGYRINEPFSIFKNIGLNLNHWSSFDFGGTYLGQGGNTNGFATFANNYEMGMGVNFNSNELSTSHLRGGPAYKLPGNLNEWIWLGSDGRKKVRVSMQLSNSKWFENGANDQSIFFSVQVKPMNNLMVQFSPGYSVSNHQQQYVAEAVNGNEPRYILSNIDQKTLNASLRVNWNLTPDLSIQYWGQPFFATGDYHTFKYVTDPKNEVYKNRFITYTESQIQLNETDEIYEVDENIDNIVDYTFDKPDFNSKVFLHNLVMRWEYMPGSVLFFVWSQNREQYTTDPQVAFNDNLHDMFDFKPYNTFLVKLSYRIGI